MGEGENRTIIGEDGILRSSIKVDFEDYPKFDCSYGQYLLGRGEGALREVGDRVLVRNADLCLRNVEKDDVSLDHITLQSFIQKSYLLSKAFYSLGLKKGDYFGIYLPNSTEFHTNVFGAWLCGATVSPADYGLTETGLVFQLEEIRPKIVVCFQGNLQRIKGALKKVGLDNHTKVVLVSLLDDSEVKAKDSYSYLSLLKCAESLPDIPEELNNHFDPDVVPLLVWSSGTTGRPKAIQLLNKMCRWYIRAFQSDFFGEEHIDFLQTTCFFHLGGFFNTIMGLTCDFISNFFPVEALECPDGARKIFLGIDKFKTNYFMGGSHHVMRMAGATKEMSEGLDLTSMETVTPAGSGVPQDTYEQLLQHFPKLTEVSNWYGQTEFGSAITYSSTPKYLGYVFNGIEVKIADPITEEPLKPNEVGEIMARCPYVMKGYLNRPEENAKFFGKDGFIHTGDQGRYDENGILYYEGRLKEMIKYQNIHIHPIEIEEVLQKHPGVKEVGVFGKPNPLDQEHITAAVVKNEGAEVTENDLKKLVEGKLENSKQLRGGVLFVEELPRNLQGKLQRKKLIQLVEQN